MGLPIAKAMKDTKAKIVADILVEEIFIHYGPPRKLLSDNGINLLVNIIEYYLQKLHI